MLYLTIDAKKIQDLRRMLNEPTSIYWTDLELQKMLDYFGFEFLQNVITRKIMWDNRISEVIKRIEILEEKVGV